MKGKEVRAMALTLNPDVIRWAVERSGIPEEKVRKAFKKYPEWLDQSHRPTLKQLMDFTRMVHINLCDVYAPDIPDYGFQIADFRTTEDAGVVAPSPELYDTIEQTKRRQDWMRDYFTAEGHEPIPLVGAWKGVAMTPDHAVKLARMLHTFLGLDERWAFGLKSPEAAVRVLRNAVESRGISVAINGVVGDNSHRSLEVKEFRGFVLSDEIAPVVFINGQDAKSAQLFTIIHELCHLAFAETGVVNPANSEGDSFGFDASMERFCDRVAAEFLVDSDPLVLEWREVTNDGVMGYDRVNRIARNHKVTFMVVARQAFDKGLLASDDFFGLYRQHKAIVDSVEGKPKRSSPGGDPYANKRNRLGAVFSEAVWSAYNSDVISLGEAYELAGLSSTSFDEYFKRLFQ